MAKRVERSRWFSAALLAVAALASAGFHAQEVPARPEPFLSAEGFPTSRPGELVTAYAGDLPLILTAPHGGTLRIPGATTRTGQGVAARRGAKSNFTMVLDRSVDKVTYELANEIQRRTGKRPYIVVANFSRRFVDANRTPEEGTETPAAREQYDVFHGHIRQYREEIIRKWGRGLLVDIHGHGGDPDLLIRGTADWTSVRNLVETWGKDAVTGPDGLLGPLEAAGVRIFPTNADNHSPENPALNGGFITRHYGSYAGGSFDAIQFECGNAQRAPTRIPAFARAIADSLVPFTEKYLLDPTFAPPATRPAARRAPATAPATKPG